MLKRIFFLILCLIMTTKGALAWSISIPAEIKILSERLNECEKFEHTQQNLFDIKLRIIGRKGDLCKIELDLTNVSEKNKNLRHYECAISDFNIEEVKLAFEQATVKVVDMEKETDDTVILELFEGFKKNNICK